MNLLCFKTLKLKNRQNLGFIPLKQRRDWVLVKEIIRYLTELRDCKVLFISLTQHSPDPKRLLSKMCSAYREKETL